MSLEITGATQGAKRDTNIVSVASNYTQIYWYRITSTVIAANYRTAAASFNDPTYNAWAGIYSDNNSNLHSLQVNNSSGGVQSAKFAMELNRWYHFAYRRTGTSHEWLINGAVFASVTHDLSTAPAFTTVRLGYDGFSLDDDAFFQEYREWDTNLSNAEIAAEALSPTAVRTANLIADTPLVSDYLDDSGNGNDWTAIGSNTFTALTWPHNISAELALTISALPFAGPAPLTVSSGGITYTVWWKYTAQPGDLVVGFFFFGDLATYRPATNVFSPTSSTVYLAMNYVAPDINKRVQFPVVAGTTYWLEIETNAGNPSPAVLTQIEGEDAPFATHQAGDIFVPTDVFSGGFPATIMPPSGDYTVRRFVWPFPFGEGGDTLADGTILMQKDNTHTLDIYDSSFNFITNVAPGITSTLNPIVRTDHGTQRWFWGRWNTSGTTLTVKKIAADGTIMQTWTPVTGAVAGGRALAAANDESILYFTQVLLGPPAGFYVRRFDLNASVLLSDLAVAVTGYAVSDILVMPDDTIIVDYARGAPADFFIRRYATDGTILNTYSQPDYASAEHRLGYALTSQTDSFWTMYMINNPTLGLARFRRIRFTDGVVLNEVEQNRYDRGISAAPETASPLGKFGPVASCPLMILQTGVPQAEGEERRIIRRLRQMPHISAEQAWLRYNEFHLDLETGVGLPEGQGEDPQLMLRWSNDGGWTWSNEHWLTAGRTGEYTWQAVWRRLGRSRDRVFEVVVSDPVKWRLLDVYLDTAPGQATFLQGGQ